MKLFKKKTTKSHVLQWGDLSFTKEPVGDFVGGKKPVTPTIA